MGEIKIGADFDLELDLEFFRSLIRIPMGIVLAKGQINNPQAHTK
jgi:hypothetical protein